MKKRFISQRAEPEKAILGQKAVTTTGEEEDCYSDHRKTGYVLSDTRKDR